MSGQPAPRNTPALPCPECTQRMPADTRSTRRIGNRRAECTTCNTFAANVRRQTWNQLKSLHSDEYERIRLQVELDLYAQVIQSFDQESQRLKAAAPGGPR